MLLDIGIPKNMPFETQLLDLSAINAATVHAQPFPYAIINQSLIPSQHQVLGQDYPVINDAGSFPLTSVKYGSHFAQLISELKSDAFRNIIAEKFSMDLTDKPVMITVRGRADQTDGRIHKDSKSKLITVLLYMNEAWQPQEGQLRLLYNDHDLDNFATEISPHIGTMLIFKVTENGWHGHKTFVGNRRVIQLNYVTHTGALQKHALRHRISATFKAWRRKLLGHKHECVDC
jgi:SM-20-related protein